MAELTISADEIQGAVEEYVAGFEADTEREEIGTVIDAGDGIAHVEGLPSVMTQELLEFPGGVLGVALNLDEHDIGAVILGDFEKIEQGQQVKRTGEVLSVPVGDAFLGRVVNPLGQPIDGRGDVETDERRALELQAPSVVQRQGVSEPLQTGIKAIDSQTPIGRGQRQLIIGDRKTGKTAVCVDTILNQRQNWETGDPDQQVRCVYVAIGQKGTTIASVRQTLEDGGAMEYTTIVASPASDSAGFKWLAPYTGSSIAQHWMYDGKHVLIVFDDLTKQAEAYRAISLLLRRPPGREAYPGDVFYLHSRLLERCAKLSDELGGGSLTGLPIIETKANDISAYIPTNVISITDGQCFLETDLFNQGVRPAINVGVSVSRVGGAAQIKAMKEVAGSLRLDLSQYRELESFAAFASDLDETSKKQLDRGARLVELLKQPQNSPMPVEEQVVAIFLGTRGHLDSVPVEDVQKFEREFLEHVKGSHEGILKEIRESKKLSEELEEKLVKVVNDFKKGFDTTDGSSVVRDEHVDAMDDEDVEKESVKVRKPEAEEEVRLENSGSHTARTTRPHPLRRVDQEDHQGPGDDRDVAYRQGTGPSPGGSAIRSRDHQHAHRARERQRTGSPAAGRTRESPAGGRAGGVVRSRAVRRIQRQRLPAVRGAVLPASLGGQGARPVCRGAKSPGLLQLPQLGCDRLVDRLLRAARPMRTRRRSPRHWSTPSRQASTTKATIPALTTSSVSTNCTSCSPSSSRCCRSRRLPAGSHRWWWSTATRTPDRTRCSRSSRMPKPCSARCCRGM